MGDVTVIKPAQKLRGVLSVPSDKSITHRAVLFSALAKGLSTIENPLEGEDCLSTLGCIEELGCKVEKRKGLWKIHGLGIGNFTAPHGPLDCGNSGTTMRLLSGILAAQKFTSELYGDKSLSKRPMDRVAHPLTKMGAKFFMREGRFAPFRIKGTPSLKAISWKNPVASAQVKSAVLLAGLHTKGLTRFTEPYLSRNHSEIMLKACGAKIKINGARVSVKGPATLKQMNWVVPSDFSSAAFFIGAAVLVKNSHVTLTAVNLNPTRTGLLKVLKKAGVKFRIKNFASEGEPRGTLEIKYCSTLKSFRLTEKDSATLIDEVPLLAVLATQAKGRSVFKGLKELRVKETDRISALVKNLSLLGARVKELPDGMIIDGPTELKGATVESFEDHRIAMAMAIAGLIANRPTSIRGSSCVAISYPNFWKDLKSLQ